MSSTTPTNKDTKSASNDAGSGGLSPIMVIFITCFVGDLVYRQFKPQPQVIENPIEKIENVASEEQEIVYKDTNEIVYDD